MADRSKFGIGHHDPWPPEALAGRLSPHDHAPPLSLIGAVSFSLN